MGRCNIYLKPHDLGFKRSLIYLVSLIVIYLSGMESLDVVYPSLLALKVLNTMLAVHIIYVFPVEAAFHKNISLPTPPTNVVSS